MYNSFFGFQKAPFGVTPDANLFYANPDYQEAFATLHYGIKAKKGFILVTGEAGTGKTTLLRKLVRGLEATTRAVFIFNTYLSFMELLQFILRDLQLPTKELDRMAMIEELNGYLIEQFRKGRIVCLLIDEAQNLSDETLEGLRLLSNLETDNQKLLQIVLMGHVELEGKLDQSNLRQLKQRVALRYRLSPLRSNEVGLYIDFRLQAAGYQNKLLFHQKKLFHRKAVEQIAFYSKGIPRLINMICDNALLVAYGSSKKRISAEIIHEVARDLRLGEQGRLENHRHHPQEFGAPKEKEEILRPSQNDLQDDLLEGLGRALSQEIQMRKVSQRRRTRQRNLVSIGIGLLVFFILIFGGAGAVFYPDQARDYLSDLGGNVDDFIGLLRTNIQKVRQDGGALHGNGHTEMPYGAAPPPQDTSTEEELPEISFLPENTEPSESLASAPSAHGSPPPSQSHLSSPVETEEIQEPEVESPAPRAPSEPTDEIEPVPKKQEKQGRAQIADNPEIGRRTIQIQIYKALRNRAITGVNVSLIDGVAYLHGEVHTERQKLAAEQAARSVPAVKSIRNRIVVSTSEPPDKIKLLSKRQGRAQIADDPEIDWRTIQIQIYKALRNRAITGVNVSLIDGIAYLHGEVPTERQKLAAEQAARSVSAVRSIRNRIVVR